MKVKSAKKCCYAEKTIVEKSEPIQVKKAGRKPIPGKEVVFTIHAEKGKEVYLAGEFNNWNPTAKKMAYKARQGLYTATIKLVEGEYQYKFVIDGVWCADPENINSVANDQGTFNSVITVK